MQAFLGKTAEYLTTAYGEHIDNVCIVLPNRRAGLFLKKHLARHLGRTTWAPKVVSIEDFIFEISGLNIMDPVYLQFELFSIYKEVEGDKSDEFGDFLKWGRILLNDFNEIDKYLIDAPALFGYLTDIRAMELWNPGKLILTEFELKYLHFYRSLKVLYEKLVKVLKEKKEVYPGLAYRLVADKVDDLVRDTTWKKIIFVGFNALTAAEKKIIFAFSNGGKAEIIWDADHYYLDDDKQEAGRFIRRYLRETGINDFKWIDDSYKKKDFRINIIGVPQKVLQAKVAGNLLSTINISDAGNTAVVLNDESILDPLLNSIPANVTNFNLTMGLPLKSTPLFQLVDSVFSLQVNILKLNPGNSNVPKIYFRDILRILDHPYLRLDGKGDEFNPVVQIIRTSNKVFFTVEELISYLSSSQTDWKVEVDSIFKPWGSDMAAAIEHIADFLRQLNIKFSGKDSEVDFEDGKASVELEYLFFFMKIIQKLRDLIRQYPYIKTVATLRELFVQLSSSLNIPFYGEPLSGLQVMGMLEAQSLDFENIIILSANEDLIPTGKSGNSFVPFEIRNQFSLPTHKERNAVFAYHFYRLLQRTKSAFILYNTEHGDLGGNEKSRFITQLLYELPSYNPDVRITEDILSLPVAAGSIHDAIVIPKNPEIMQKLIGFGGKGFSASSINIWRNCTLQFYLSYLAGIGEPDEPEETIESATLGNVIHEILREFYAPIINQTLTVSDIERMRAQAESFARKAFVKYYKNGDVEHGKNLLMVRVIHEYINNLLDTELNSITKAGMVHEILEVESLYEQNRSIQTKSGAVEIKLKGYIDRIDRTANKIRIIDYKTGKVEARELRLKIWEELKTESRYRKYFQVLFYAYLYWKKHDSDPGELDPGIITFRNLKGGFLRLGYPDDVVLTASIMQKFEEILESILDDIFNPELPFVQTENEENCRYCPYREICNKTG